MTFRKVTPATKLVNEKKLSQAQMTPWHVPSSIWVHLGPWGSIFLVKNQFSHIFPASAWSPFLSVILTDKLARLQSIQNRISFISAKKYLGVFQSFQKWAIESVRTIARALHAGSHFNALDQSLKKKKSSNN